MGTTIKMDSSGRLVLPANIRTRLNLRGGGRFRAELIAGRIELTPVEVNSEEALRTKAGVTVLAHTGVRVNAADATADVRHGQEERGQRQEE